MTLRATPWMLTAVLCACFTGGGGDGAGTTGNGTGATGGSGGDRAGGVAGTGVAPGGGTAPGVAPGEPNGAGGAASTDPSTGAAGFCSLPPEAGPCEAAFERWYFDPAANGCRTFTYGGCEGNDNNFESSAACKEACLGGDAPGQPVPPPPLPPPDEACAAFGDPAFMGDYCAAVCAGKDAPEVPPGCPVFPCACDGVPQDDACAAGIPLDPTFPCEGTIANRACFKEASDACACLGCPDTCLILESWPQQAQCE